jgi:hypothetical protein
MVRCSFRRRLAAVAVLSSLALPLAVGTPAQARETPPASWLGALVHQMTQWMVPSWWPLGGGGSGHPASVAGRVQAQPATTSSCVGPSSDPDGCPKATCYTGSTDPDGRCQ